MAFCGANFSSENEEKKINIDYSFKNVRAFSTKRGQMSELSQEGLFVKDDNNDAVDNRTVIRYTNAEFKRTSYWGLCQLTCKVTGGTGFGTSSKITLNGVTHCLTCAHNLVKVSVLDNTVEKRSSPLSFDTRQGANSWSALWELDKKSIRVHPKYNGDPGCGFDIAVGSFLTNRGSKNFTGKFYDKSQFKEDAWYAPDPKELEEGMDLEVAGYPGEKLGFPYLHKGKIKHVRKTKHGGYLLFYNIDTTPGNSGSPIMIVDKGFNESHGARTCEKNIIGVHTGSCDVSKLNYGTLITPSLYKWMKGEESIKGKEESIKGKGDTLMITGSRPPRTTDL